jgi:carboxylesterase type B
MFGNLDKSWRPFAPEDYALSSKMIDYIASFARTGDPNNGKLPQWPAISSSSATFMGFAADSLKLLTPWQCRKLVWHTALKDKGPL